MNLDFLINNHDKRIKIQKFLIWKWKILIMPHTEECTENVHKIK